MNAETGLSWIQLTLKGLESSLPISFPLEANKLPAKYCTPNFSLLLQSFLLSTRIKMKKILSKPVRSTNLLFLPKLNLVTFGWSWCHSKVVPNLYFPDQDFFQTLDTMSKHFLFFLYHPHSLGLQTHIFRTPDFQFFVWLIVLPWFDLGWVA